MLLRDVSIRGTQTQDRSVGEPRDPKRWLKRYGLAIGIGLAVLVLAVWSAKAWLSSEKVIPYFTLNARRFSIESRFSAMTRMLRYSC